MDTLKIGDPVLLYNGSGPGGWIVGLDETYAVVDSGRFNIQVLRATVVYDNTRQPLLMS